MKEWTQLEQDLFMQIKSAYMVGTPRHNWTVIKMLWAGYNLSGMIQTLSQFEPFLFAAYDNLFVSVDGCAARVTAVHEEGIRIEWVNEDRYEWIHEPKTPEGKELVKLRKP